MQNGYSLCLREWALDKSIKTELGLLLIISSLTAENGYCYASNEYFSSLFEIDVTTVSKKISKLEKKGYIELKYNKNNGREITIKFNRYPIGENANTLLAKTPIPIGENANNNIISNNNINNTKVLQKENLNNQNGSQQSKLSLDIPKQTKKSFSYVNALKSLGVDKEIANEYVKARKTQLKASLSERSFKQLKNEIDKCQANAEDCILFILGEKFRTGKIYTGFKAEWLHNSEGYKEYLKQNKIQIPVANKKEYENPFENEY